MKSQTQAYYDKEEGSKRQPGELYHFWYESSHWYHTDGDVAVVYGGNTYVPATLNRGPVTYDTKLEANTMMISIAKVEQPIAEFVAAIPVSLIWVSVHKIHRDMSPIEISPTFIGQVAGVGFKGLEAQVRCVGFDHFLKQVIPRYRYGVKCQHTLYDPNTCGRDGLIRADFTTIANVYSLDSTGINLTIPVLGGQADGYYTLGYLTFGTYQRMVTAHVGNIVTLRYPIVGLISGSVISASAGCDGTRVSCQTKFNNLDNCLNFEDVPRDNPSTWMGT